MTNGSRSMAVFGCMTTTVESIRDHALLFVNGTDWNPQQYATVRAAKDYKTAAAALKTDGYATDPDYPQKLIHLIETWNLTQYDS